VLEVIQAMQPALAQAGPSAQIVFTLTEMEQADALRQRLQRSQAALMMAVQERRRQ
jgi:allophanate hydrolase subunit 2